MVLGLNANSKLLELKVLGHWRDTLLLISIVHHFIRRGGRNLIKVLYSLAAVMVGYLCRPAASRSGILSKIWNYPLTLSQNCFTMANPIPHGTWRCLLCDEEFATQRLLQEHVEADYPLLEAYFQLRRLPALECCPWCCPAGGNSRVKGFN